MNYPQSLNLLHGADYNPEQWLDRPEILAEDIQLMKKAKVNCVSIGIFSWAFLEPVEGQYEFDWLEQILDRLYENGINFLLATPSGAKPYWLGEKYEEVRRVDRSGRRELQGGRHNHCYTSPIYRKKIGELNRKLAERFGKHKGLIFWHISNEYSGECYCPLCAQAFRDWLKNKYKTLEKLNHEWWANFWSHTITDWSQINPPMDGGEGSIMGLNLDWQRFISHQTIDFMKAEISAVRSGGSDIPATANFMHFFGGINYFEMARHLDIVSWDNYPLWHKGKENPDDEIDIAVDTALMHNLVRSLKKQPFLLMESTPSTTNWTSVSRLKRPNMHLLSSVQAVAHGSNSVQYFQWRKSRGSCEQFHGAVVDHSGRSDTRVFGEVTAVGQTLQNLPKIAQTNIKSDVAIIYDWENKWAIEGSQGPRNCGPHYLETVLDHYRSFWEMGISADIVDMTDDFADYKLVVAPMLFLQRSDIATKLKKFTSNGGVLVGTYWSGVVNENTLCYEGDRPNELTDLFGIRAEEIDSLYDGQYNEMTLSGKKYKLTDLCELSHVISAEVLSVYDMDFYQGMPAFTRNKFGDGTAYYLAARTGLDFLRELYKNLAQQLNLDSVVGSIVETLPNGVVVSKRSGEKKYWFVQNYNYSGQKITLKNTLKNAETGESLSEVEMSPYGYVVLSE